MKITRHFVLSALAFILVEASLLFGAKPADFSNAKVGEIWKEVWQSGDSNTSAPTVEKLSEHEVVESMTGKWTVMFGVMPDELTITIGTNRLVEVSGQKDGYNWKKTGEWRVVSDLLVLILEHEDLPSYLFRVRGQFYIFDPWAKRMMSELKRSK